MTEEKSGPPYPVTPDGRYFVVRGRLWRCTDPSLPEADRKRLQKDLMAARSALGHARRAGDDEAREAAREAIHTAKLALGERGEPWWGDGAKDWNRVERLTGRWAGTAILRVSSGRCFCMRMWLPR